MKWYTLIQQSGACTQKQLLKTPRRTNHFVVWDFRPEPNNLAVLGIYVWTDGSSSWMPSVVRRHHFPSGENLTA